MKKLFYSFVLVVTLICFSPQQALSSGYSMAVLMDDVIVLVKFDAGSFSAAEYATLSQLVGGLLTSNVPGSFVFYHNNLGDPDVLRGALTSFYNSYEVIFLNISQGDPRVAGMGPNIWIDGFYDNDAMYVATLGFPAMFLGMALAFF